MEGKDKKITLVNNLPGRRGITLPHIPFKALFPKEGARVHISLETLEKIRYEPGVEYFLRNGIIGILEEEGNSYLKEELGLETQKLLTKEEIEKIVVLSPEDFREKYIELTPANHEKIIDFLTESGTVSFNVNKIIKEISGIDVINKIKIFQLDKEEQDKLEKRE